MLAKKEILAAMRTLDDPLVVTPLLDEEQVGVASVDLRLGHEFIVMRRSSLTHFDPAARDDWKKHLNQSQQRIRIRTFRSFVLHPGDLVLGATLEYVAVPRNMGASVEGRSSWGRLGLIIATASSVSPGFKGCITLEMLNGGVVPLTVCPGMRIAQLIFHSAESTSGYAGKYNCPTGPQFSRLDRDAEMRLWSDVATSRQSTPEAR